MGAVLVTGCSGAGKSSVAAALAARRRCALDADDDAELVGWVDSADRPVRLPAAPDPGWLASHRWVWDLARLDLLIASAAPETLFVCGNAANAAAAWDRFDLVCLLAVDEATMLARLVDPTRDHDFGRAAGEREWLRSSRPRHEAEMLALGAVRIATDRPLDDVVAAVLAAAGAGRPAGLWRRTH